MKKSLSVWPGIALLFASVVLTTSASSAFAQKKGGEASPDDTNGVEVVPDRFSSRTLVRLKSQRLLDTRAVRLEMTAEVRTNQHSTIGGGFEIGDSVEMDFTLLSTSPIALGEDGTGEFDFLVDGKQVEGNKLGTVRLMRRGEPTRDGYPYRERLVTTLPLERLTVIAHGSHVEMKLGPLEVTFTPHALLNLRGFADAARANSTVK